jgi:hypothetical protein
MSTDATASCFESAPLFSVTCQRPNNVDSAFAIPLRRARFAPTAAPALASARMNGIPVELTPATSSSRPRHWACLQRQVALVPLPEGAAPRPVQRAPVRRRESNVRPDRTRSRTPCCNTDRFFSSAPPRWQTVASRSASGTRHTIAELHECNSIFTCARARGVHAVGCGHSRSCCYGRRPHRPIRARRIAAGPTS